MTLKDRFAHHYTRTDGCWLWTGRVDRHGYGKVRVNGIERIAHRAVYEEHVGPVPTELELDHLCGNRLCVKPEHLEAVTGEENRRRQWTAEARQCAAERMRKVHAERRATRA